MRVPKARRLPLAYTHIVWLAPKELNFVYTLIRRALKTVEDRAKIYFGGEGMDLNHRRPDRTRLAKLRYTRINSALFSLAQKREGLLGRTYIRW